MLTVHIPPAIQRDTGIVRPIRGRHSTCRSKRSLNRKDTINLLCFPVFQKKLRKQGKTERRDIMKGRETFLKIVLFLFMIVPATWSSVACGATLTLKVPSDYPTIQAAVDAAADGDSVLVAGGTYTESLIVEKSIAIGCDVNANPDPCIIDVSGMVVVGITFRGEGTKGSLLSDFTIKGGNGDDYGGGISCENGAAPTISDCIIVGNTARLFGGGLSCYNSSPIIAGCTITNNMAGYYGGGIYCYNSSPIIAGCTITNNMAGYYGGGIYLEANSSPEISNCMITGNSTALCGGGIACAIASSPLITNSTVADNLVNGETFDGITYSQGGGIYMYGSCMPTITNSVFWNNVAIQGPEIYMESESILKIGYSDIKGGKDNVSGDMPTSTSISAASTTNSILDWSDTNKNSDPRFVDAKAGDYHLAADSPCIEAGTNVVVDPESSDFEGDPRILGLIVDIGADEAQTNSVDQTEVEIKVRPGSRHNKIDLGAWGFLPVAVLSTKDFDATSIDPKTVEFAGAEPMHWVRTHVNRDRKADMLFFFWIRHLKFDSAEHSTKATITTEVTLIGESTKAGPIIGRDTVTIMNPKNKRHWWSKFAQLSQKKGHRNSR